MKIALSLIVLFFACPPMHADVVSYGFDGDLSSHFTRQSDSGSFYGQQNSRMEFHNNNTSFETTTGDLYLHNSMLPQANQSFTASVDLTLPSSYNNLQGNDTEEFVRIGLAVFHAPNGLGQSGFQAFTSTLAVEKTGRAFSSLAFNENSEYSFSGMATSLESATMTIGYDALTGLLTAEAGGAIFSTLDINDATNNWGMSGNDVFQIGIFGDTFNEAIASTTPLFQDNFTGVTAVPEPSALVILIPFMATIVRRRRAS